MDLASFWFILRAAKKAVEAQLVPAYLKDNRFLDLTAS
jgi:hypothetical protein